MLTLSTATIGLECAGIIKSVIINITTSFILNVEKQCGDMTIFNGNYSSENELLEKLFYF